MKFRTGTLTASAIAISLPFNLRNIRRWSDEEV
jgi:hypothetical protein